MPPTSEEGFLHRRPTVSKFPRPCHFDCHDTRPPIFPRSLEGTAGHWHSVDTNHWSKETFLRLVCAAVQTGRGILSFMFRTCCHRRHIRPCVVGNHKRRQLCLLSKRIRRSYASAGLSNRLDGPFLLC